MALGPKDPELREWRSAALVALGLLFVPFLVWLILPAPPKISIPQLVAATIEASSAPSKPKPAQVAESRPTETSRPAESAGPVRGRVIGPDRHSVPRVLVGCTDKDLHSVSDLDGSFELPAEADGCTAVARKPGFGSSAPVKLRAGDERSNQLELLGGGKIEGVVVDDSGAPIPKFMLAVEKFIGQEGEDEGSGGRARTIENDKGRFTMEQLTPGKYVLSASAEGHPPAKSDTLEVEPGRTLSGVKIVVPRGVALSGVVTDAETRKPLAEAHVALDSMTSSGVSSTPAAKTDASGAYTLEGVPPSGPFSIRVTMEGYRTRIVSGLSARGGPMKTDVELSKRDQDGGAESEMAGIGAVLAPMPSAFGAMIVTVVPDGPAAQAGLQRLDTLVRIDGQSTDQMMLADCIQRLRGEPGSRVSVTVKRGDQEMQFNLTRAVVMR